MRLVDRMRFDVPDRVPETIRKTIYETCVAYPFRYEGMTDETSARCFFFRATPITRRGALDTNAYEQLLQSFVKIGKAYGVGAILHTANVYKFFEVHHENRVPERKVEPASGDTGTLNAFEPNQSGQEAGSETGGSEGVVRRKRRPRKQPEVG